MMHDSHKNLIAAFLKHMRSDEPDVTMYLGLVTSSPMRMSSSAAVSLLSIGFRLRLVSICAARSRRRYCVLRSVIRSAWMSQDLELTCRTCCCCYLTLICILLHVLLRWRLALTGRFVTRRVLRRWLSIAARRRWLPIPARRRRLLARIRRSIGLRVCGRRVRARLSVCSIFELRATCHRFEN